MNPVLYLIYIGALTGLMLFLGGIVFQGSSKSRSSLIFTALTAITALWVLANSYVANFRDSNFVPVATTADLLLALPLVAVYWYFIDSLFNDSKNEKSRLSGFISKIYIPLTTLLAAILVISGNIVTFSGSPTEIIYSSLFELYSVIIGSIFLFTLIRLVVLVRKSGSKEKSQYKYLLSGIMIAGLSLIAVNTLIPLIWGEDSQVATNISYIGLLIFIALTARAIIVHKLFNARLIAAKSVAYAFSVFIIATIFVVSSLVFGQFIIEEKIPIELELFFVTISILTAFLFQPVKRFFDKASNSIFYRDAYDGQEFLNAVNAKIVTSSNLNNLLNETAANIRDEIKLNFCNFYIDQSAAIEFHTAGTSTAMFAKPEWSSLIEEIDQSGEKVVTAEQLEGDEKTLEHMRTLGIELVLKMSSKDQDVGYMILSERRSGTNFGLQDIQILEIIADELAIAVQNTVQYEQIAQFNVTLQKRIEDATAELQRSNEKLRKLDEAKDEFISMASHQLRTPLTSVKGYISMVLEGDAGNVNDNQKKFLDQAYLSSQRMVYLIADLLNVSRLKTGKFIIEAKPTYLPDVVESEIAQLYETAKARDLQLVFDKPKEFATMNLDETKIRQVIMNFADNAIYYTPNGGRIEIKLKQTKTAVEFTVNDSGIGVPKSEQHHLFTKFYRAGNAKKARPDGTGLGLFMAKKVVVAQGGAIIFKTTEGKGSTFGFSFPRKELEVTD
jgi:signal transduction histidine kinase